MELKPVLIKQKSYYGKASYEITRTANSKGIVSKDITLYSYNTKVCTIHYELMNTSYELNYSVHRDLLFSHTTLKHIKDFIYQFLDYKLSGKKELEELNKLIWCNPKGKILEI